MVCAASKGQIRAYRSAVARYKTATCGMWSCPDDGYRWMRGARGECVVLRLESAVEAKRAGLLGPSLLHHLTGARRQALFATPKVSLRGDCQLCFPLHLISCFAKTAIYMFYTSHCGFYSSRNGLLRCPFPSAAKHQTCSLQRLSRHLVVWHPQLFSARQPLKAKRDSASKRKSLSRVSVLGVTNGPFGLRSFPWNCAFQCHMIWTLPVILRMILKILPHFIRRNVSTIGIKKRSFTARVVLPGRNAESPSFLSSRSDKITDLTSFPVRKPKLFAQQRSAL